MRSDVAPLRSRVRAGIVAVVMASTVFACSGVQARIRSLTPCVRAFVVVKATARSLTSTASTCAAGLALAKATATTPYPAPRSKRRRDSGRGVWLRNNTAVPRSSPSWENTPDAVVNVHSVSQNRAVMVRRCSSPLGVSK